MPRELCRFGQPTCRGELWTCLACGEKFCRTHWHVTSRGRGVECAACEAARLDAKADSVPYPKFDALDAAAERLDVKDK